MTTLIAVIVIVMLLVLFWSKSGASTSRSTRAMKRVSKHTDNSMSKNSRYHSVSIMSDERCCRHAASLAKKKFLSNEAPKLPLAECNLARCRCKYVHYADRREKTGERRVDYGMAHDLYGAFGEQNRREKSKGRRVTDMQLSHSQ